MLPRAIGIALHVVPPPRLLLPPLGGLRGRLPMLSRCPLHVVRGEAMLPGVNARVASVPCSAALLAGRLAAHATQLGRLWAHVVVWPSARAAPTVPITSPHPVADVTGART